LRGWVVYVAAIEKGWLHRKIADYFSHEQSMIERGDIKLVGYNIHKAPSEVPPIEVFQCPEGMEERQKARLARLKERKENEKVSSALVALGEACQRKENVVPYTVECARVACSEGEMYKVFKQAYGLWKLPVLW